MKLYYDSRGITIYHGDSLGADMLSEADLLVTDPPFNVGKDYGVTQDSVPDPVYRAWMRRMREAGPARQAWVIPSVRLSLFASILGPEAHPIVVRRGAQGPKRWGWYDQFDMLLVLGRPNRWVSNLWDDIRLKGEGWFFREETYGHPGYTPYPLMARLVGLFSEPGETIVDPFAGTGTLLVAAKKAGRRAIGIEIEERYCEVAVKRLAQEVLDLEAA